MALGTPSKKINYENSENVPIRHNELSAARRLPDSDTSNDATTNPALRENTLDIERKDNLI